VAIIDFIDNIENQSK